MRVVCAWCDALVAEGTGAISHGICGPCFLRYFPEILRGSGDKLHADVALNFDKPLHEMRLQSPSR